MEELDERACLFLGDPLPFDCGEVYPLTIGEIKEIGFSNFYTILQIIISDENDLEFVPENTIVYPFDIFLSNIVYCPNEDFKHKIVLFLKKIFKIENIFFDENFICLDNGISIGIDNYEEFSKIIMKQYCIKKEIRPFRTEKQKEMDRLRAEKRKKYSKWLEDERDDIIDLISSICSVHPSIDAKNINGQHIYYLIDQFKRINKRDDFFIGIKSLLAGASKDDVKLIHWTKKIVN